MDALVGGAAFPSLKVGVKALERVKLAAFEGAVLHVGNVAFQLALVLGTIRAARHRLNLIAAAKHRTCCLKSFDTGKGWLGVVGEGR